MFETDREQVRARASSVTADRAVLTGVRRLDPGAAEGCPVVVLSAATRESEESGEVIPAFGKGWSVEESMRSLIGEACERRAIASSHRAPERWRWITRTSSDRVVQYRRDGCIVRASALAPTVRSASRAAFLELIERDAFSRAWQTGECGVRRSPVDSPDPALRRLNDWVARSNLELVLLRLPAPHAIPVITALLVDRCSAPALSVGLAARAVESDAAVAAASEAVQVRAVLRWKLAAPSAGGDDSRAARIETPIDHLLHYAAPDRLGEAAWWWERAREGKWSAARVDERAELVRSFRAESTACGLLDVTPPDLRAEGMRVVRAIALGLEPLRHGEIATASTRVADRLAEHPHATCLNGRPRPFA